MRKTEERKGWMNVNWKAVWKRITASILAVGLALSAAPTVVFADEAAEAEPIGKVILSGETFTLGQGYFYEPTLVDLYEGDTCATVLVRAFEEAGLEIKYTGNMSSFYLSQIKGADKGWTCLPQYLQEYLDSKNVTLKENKDEWLGEFDYTNMSGWMYTVNGTMANVGMGQYKPNSGDVIRLQFTTYGYGWDLGCGWGAAADMADKTEITEYLARTKEWPDDVKDRYVLGENIMRLFPGALTFNDVVKELTVTDRASKTPCWLAGGVADGVTQDVVDLIVEELDNSVSENYTLDDVNGALALNERVHAACEYLANYRLAEQNDENGELWGQLVKSCITAIENSNDAEEVAMLFKKAKSAINSLANNGDEPDPEEPQAPSKIPDNFENDLWLQYDFKELLVGESAEIYPRRVPQIISDAVNNDVQRPLFHFEVVSGSSVGLDTDATTDKVTVTAIMPGVTIIKVTYDELEYKDLYFGKTADCNAAYVVFSVSKSDPEKTGISILSEAKIKAGEPLTSYDTIYFTDGDTVDYPYYLAIKGADSVQVTCNGHIVKGDGGKYILPLENRSNIIGVTAKNKAGIRHFYQVIDARKIEINVANKTNPGQPLESGDTAVVSFRGIANPVYKLATIYNPTWHSTGTRASAGTFVEYTMSKDTFKGYCSQWDLATKNSFEVTFDKGGEFTFTGGRIFSSWWGSQLGADKGVYGQGDPNLNAPIMERYFCQLPDFTVSVKKTEAEILQDAKDAASAELDGYKDPANYDDAAKDAMADVIAAAKDAIAAAEDKDAVDKALADAKAALDVIAKEATDRKELQDAKDAATAELDGYKDASEFDEDTQKSMADVVAAGKEAIAAAEDKDAVAKALTDAKAALDAIEKTYTDKKELEAAKEAAAAELESYKDASEFDEDTQKSMADVVAAGKEAIAAAEDKDAVAKALTDAKAALDAIEKTYTDKKELEAAKEAAIAELEGYKDASKYDEAGQKAIAEAVADGKAAINAAADKAAVAKALADAKTILNSIPQTSGGSGSVKEPADVSDVLERTLDYIYRHTPDPTIGTFGGEWSIIALSGGEYGVASGYYDKYYENVVNTLKENNGILEGDRKYTEYSRVIMGLSAIGRDATNVGGYNLVEKLANFDKVKSQGVNGVIFALIALDTKGYETSDPDIRQKYINEILANEISGGGFDFMGVSADPDMTAMALQALTPYRDDLKVDAVVKRGVAILSKLQESNGGLSSWGSNNSESVAQTIIALCGMGIDPNSDSRFVKNGHSLLDALLTFEAKDGGFMHVQAGAATGGGAEGGVSDGMATDQAALALLAYQRMTGGKAPIYNNRVGSKTKVVKEYLSKDKKYLWRQYEDSHWELFDPTGSEHFTGWVKVDGFWYFFQRDGVMSTGWLTTGGKTYYLRPWGAMLTGWFKLDDKWYFCDGNGALQDRSDALGEIVLQYPASDDSGVWRKHDSGKWSFLKDDALAEGWLNIEGTWYFFGSDHAMATGWQMVNATWYYLDGGKMATGWKKVNGSWYYFLGWGGMKTNWLNLDGSWYYLSASGAMLANTTTPDGYKVDASGRWIG